MNELTIEEINWIIWTLERDVESEEGEWVEYRVEDIDIKMGKNIIDKLKKYPSK